MFGRTETFGARTAAAATAAALAPGLPGPAGFYAGPEAAAAAGAIAAGAPGAGAAPPTGAAPLLGGTANVVPGAGGGAGDGAPRAAPLVTVDPAIARGAPGAAAAPAAPAAPVGPDGRRKLRVLFCGTHPIGQSNGYSRVTYYICKHLGGYDDVALTLYGFQKFAQTEGSEARNDIPASVTLHDALATENPRRHGFGEKEIAGYLRAHPQDVVIIFNDPMVTTALTQTIVNELTPAERRSFKLVAYADQVYPYQKPAYIQLLNAHFDAVVAFTPYWRDTIHELGLRRTMPSYFFPHGFDPKRYYPIPRKLARLYYGLPPPSESFIVLQLNRNQPRKRLDQTMMIWADVVARHLALKKARSPSNPPKMIQLMIGTAMNACWNLGEIFEHELRRRGIAPEVGRPYLATLAKPQQMSDRDINILYNACDIGLNNCAGEGWGLTSSEHGAIGCPQVAAWVGGHKEFMKDGVTSQLIKPKWNFYVDSTQDGIGGLAEVGDPADYADAIWKYYTNASLVHKHGAAARAEILQHYRWETMVAHFHGVLKDIGGAAGAAPDAAAPRAA